MPIPTLALFNATVEDVNMVPAQLTKESKAEKNQEIDDLTEMMMRCLENADLEDFIGLCAKCKENIIGHENGCKALGALYHVNCFVCQKCRDPLVKKPFYHTDGLTYCEKDYLDTLERCDVCSEHIKERILRAVDKQYHPECFKCTDCTVCLDGVPFTLDSSNQVLCVDCYNKKFAYTCALCDKLIITEDGAETYRIIAMDKDFHVSCYKCEVCDVKFTNDEGKGCYPHNERLLCHTHYKEAVST